MQIPVKFFKVLNAPSEPAEVNAAYFVKADADSPLEFYVTDEDGNLSGFKIVDTALRMLFSYAVNLNDGTAARQGSSPFVVPDGCRAKLLSLDIDNFSNVPTAAEFTAGWNADADDVLTDPFTIADLVTDTGDFVPLFSQPRSIKVGTAAQTFGLVVTTPNGSGCMARVTGLGYLTDANGVPLPNVLGAV